MGALKLNFRKSGTGDPLVILHGLYGSSDNWLSVAKRLESQFTIYLLDLRNHGSSPHASTHLYHDLIEDVRLFFEEQHLTKAILLGHSMGGKTAMYFASQYPEMVRHLIVVDIAPKDYYVPGEESRSVREHELILKLMDDLNLVAVTTRKEIDHYLSEKIGDGALRQFLIKNIHRDKEGFFSWKINVPVLKHSLPHITNGVNEQLLADRIPILNYPVTFIKGAKSNYILETDVPKILAIYPEAKIITIPNAGHWLHAEQPELFLNALLSVI